MLASQLIRFSLLEEAAPGLDDDRMYWVVGVVLAACWLAALAVNGAWATKSLGGGPSEYRRVTGATCGVLTSTAIQSYLFGVEIACGIWLSRCRWA